MTQAVGNDSGKQFEMEEVDECVVDWVLAWQHFKYYKRHTDCPGCQRMTRPQPCVTGPSYPSAKSGGDSLFHVENR